MMKIKAIAVQQAQRAPSPLRGEGGGEGVPASKSKVELAKRLRRDQTDAERTLWFQLRDRRLNGWKFKRQVQIDKYIVDFICAEVRLIIESDGGQHVARSEHDAARTKVVEAMGYLVLRFWNNDVLQNVDGVLESVVDTVNQQAAVTPSP
jgi:very-short-patch-repair endonuclease